MPDVAKALTECQTVSTPLPITASLVQSISDSEPKCGSYPTSNVSWK